MVAVAGALHIVWLLCVLDNQANGSPPQLDETLLEGAEMKSIKTITGFSLVAVVLGGCLVLSGCSSSPAPDAEQNSMQETSAEEAPSTEAPEEEPGPATTSYDFSGLSLAIPEYWVADTNMSEAGSSLVFRTKDKGSTLHVMLDDIPQFMTVKSEGGRTVEATNEEIADEYLSISVMDSDYEQAVGDLETIGSDGSSYMRKTFYGTIDKEEGGVKSAQRNALVLLNDSSSYIEVTVFCPENEDEYLSDVDMLMSSIVSQL